jgi:LPPG:FO 2-phospho-L-lactate transferase
MSAAKHKNITALAGGVGASKLLLGLHDVIDPRALTVIVNTGDDITLHGLKISPDLDIVTYTLAGIVDAAKGWGYRGETFQALKRLAVFGRVNWFNLGDRDLARTSIVPRCSRKASRSAKWRSQFALR